MRRTGALLAALLVGAALGLGAFTFVYAKGGSYLSTDPAVCANCHIMGEHFAAWQRSSHRQAAGCALDAAHDPLGEADGTPIRAGGGGTPVANRPQIHDGAVASGDRESCIRCHTYVGHMVR